jgi:flagellar biosynthesis/type III secretory pathway protein FliH
MGRLIKKKDLPEVPLALSMGDRALFATMEREEMKARLLEELKPGLIAVATKLAEAIVDDAIEERPDRLHRKYQKALSTVADLAPGTIRVHPEGAARTGIAALSVRAGFELVMDETLHPADCIIQSGEVTVDATVETALYHFQRLVEPR